MNEHLESTTDAMTTMKLAGSATTAGVGLAQTLEIIQSGLAIVASIVGIVTTTWILIDKIRSSRKKKNDSD